MSLSETARVNILTSLLEIIQIFSNKQYQKNWITGESGIGFDDVCCYFFESAESVIERYKDFKLTEEERYILKKFYDELDRFNDHELIDYDCLPQKFINSPEWAKIRERAKEVLKAFDYKSE